MTNSIISRKVVKIVQVDWASLADAVKTDVMNKLKDDINKWQDDDSMLAMFLADAAEGVSVCVSLREGDWKKAENSLRNMDTAARECVWEFIENHSCVGLFDLLRDQDFDCHLARISLM